MKSQQLGLSERRKPAYKTEYGEMFSGKAEDLFNSHLLDKYLSKVQLIFTSPPFPLNRKKKYGNLRGDDYVDWLSSFAPVFCDYLSFDGSVVIEVGNAWEAGQPIMSTLSLKALIAFLEKGELKLCQQFICYNPARLPTPAQWVNIDRIRVKDSFTHIWWMSKSIRPKADNRRVLVEYSKAMQSLLEKEKYNPGKRPSGHNIGAKSFLKNNNGAIPSNVLTVTNTNSNDKYLQHCRERNLPTHPARMPLKLSEFFIKFLTDVNDIVMDPFSGSNTTGYSAELLKRRWLAIEPNKKYIEGSWGRFMNNTLRRTI